ncbi:unnamed protein product [Pylaiella littoralis]
MCVPWVLNSEREKKRFLANQKTAGTFSLSLIPYIVLRIEKVCLVHFVPKIGVNRKLRASFLCRFLVYVATLLRSRGSRIRSFLHTIGPSDTSYAEKVHA